MGALIRAAADGELTDEQIKAFESLCAQRDCTKDRVRFEQTLRDACGKAMGDHPCCPDALRNKIRALAASGGDAGLGEFGSGEPGSGESGSGGGVTSAPVAFAGSVAPQTRSVSFWRRSPGVLAAAAVLALFAGVLIFQSVSIPTGNTPAGWTSQQVSNRDRMASFVATEHNRCCKSESVSKSKFVMHDMDEAKAYFINTLGVAGLDVSPDVAQVGEVTFWGAGDCQVPTASKSGHFRFDATTPEGAQIRLSLFVLPDSGQLPMNEGTTYVVSSDSCKDAGVNLFVWKQTGVVYMLVSEAQDGFCRVVRDTMHAPAAVASF